jgi:adenosylhomocysteine nucleosidase
MRLSGILKQTAGCLAAVALTVMPLAVHGSAQAAEPVAISADHPIAIMSAFPSEFKALVGALKNPQSQSINGMTYVSGTLEGKPVVLMTSGVSMVNAAMTTQLLIDRFHVSRIVFSGIAGGVDPSLAVGDVIVPEEWAQPFEVIMARETPTGFAPPAWRRVRTDTTNFNMMYLCRQ